MFRGIDTHIEMMFLTISEALGQNKLRKVMVAAVLSVVFSGALARAKNANKIDSHTLCNYSNGASGCSRSGPMPKNGSTAGPDPGVGGCDAMRRTILISDGPRRAAVLIWRI